MKQGYWIDKIEDKNSPMFFCNVIIKTREGYYGGYCNYNIDIGIEPERIYLTKRSPIETWDFYNYSNRSHTYEIIYEEMDEVIDDVKEDVFKEKI